ncbi:MAG: copper chaperone PCu(A)C [Gracilimonas sp.]|uniref:copper chaperone PCu(A)C n=1 Tax=Gracilimonas sp. TaxID=1974203 RepID=UPI0019A6FEA7|nr:copper chaperone PCu(A)C [Gracilimonas sp.]MBD3616974.1 copper chaperone PCu(A)C [Gracilimonas sp.]
MKYLISIFVLTALMVTSSCNSENRKGEVNSEGVTKKTEERVRPAASGGTSAAYFTYINTLSVADTIVSVSSPQAGMAQLHESYETEDGLMGMREQKNVVIQPEESITFQQGGLHIMLMQLNEDLTKGDSVLVEIELEQAGVISRVIPVKEN